RPRRGRIPEPPQATGPLQPANHHRHRRAALAGRAPSRLHLGEARPDAAGANRRHTVGQPAGTRPCPARGGPPLPPAAPFRSGDTLNAASVFERISSTVTSGATSTRRSPPSTTSKTPRSVITRSTTPAPVSGRLQRVSNLGLPPAVCSISTTTRFTPATR